VNVNSRFTIGVKQGQGAQMPPLPLHPHPGFQKRNQTYRENRLDNGWISETTRPAANISWASPSMTAIDANYLGSAPWSSCTRRLHHPGPEKILFQAVALSRLSSGRNPTPIRSWRPARWRCWRGSSDMGRSGTTGPFTMQRPDACMSCRSILNCGDARSAVRVDY